VLITNIASQCSKTDQHFKEIKQLVEDLSKIDMIHTDFDILAFPTNLIKEQEPHTSPSAIKEHIQHKYDLPFTLMEQIDVNGSTSSMVYKFLKSHNGPFKIRDCFYTYFIVDAWGDVHEYTDLNPAELYDEIVMFINEHDEAKEQEEQEF